MANGFNNVKDAGGIFAKSAAKVLEDNLQFCKSIDKAEVSDFNGKNGYSAGDTILIPMPNQSLPTSSFDQTSTIQDVNESTVPLTLDIISSSAFAVDTLEYATELQVARTFDRIIRPAMIDLAHDFENKVITKAVNMTYNHVGTPGTTVFDTDQILQAREKMGKFLAPRDDKRHFLFDSTAGRSAVGQRKGLFQSSSEIAKQYKMGYVGTADGFNWVESEMLPTHTNGNDVTGVLTDGTLSAEGVATIHVDGLTTTTGTIKKGQIFTVAGVYACHPKTKKAYTFLQQFVVTADVTADGSGDADVAFSPAIYTTGARQNVTAFPTDNDAITFVGTASQAATQNLAYHTDAFRLATAPLIMPKNAELAAQHRYQGLNVAVVYDWDTLKRRMILRLDVLGALAGVRPEHACRIS